MHVNVGHLVSKSVLFFYRSDIFILNGCIFHIIMDRDVCAIQ